MQAYRLRGVRVQYNFELFVSPLVYHSYLPGILPTPSTAWTQRERWRVVPMTALVWTLRQSLWEVVLLLPRLSLGSQPLTRCPRWQAPLVLGPWDLRPFREQRAWRLGVLLARANVAFLLLLDEVPDAQDVVEKSLMFHMEGFRRSMIMASLSCSCQS